MKEYLIHTKQISENDCGIDCIYMLLKFHHIYIPYLDLEESLNYKGRELSLKEIIDYFNSIHVRSEVIKVQMNHIAFNNFEILKKDLPCIGLIHDADDYHYILIYKWNDKFCVYSDPSEESVTKISTYNIINKLDYLIKFDFSSKNQKSNYCSDKNYIIRILDELKSKIIFVSFLACITYVLCILESFILGDIFNYIVKEVKNINIIECIKTIFCFLFLLLSTIYIRFKVNKSLVELTGKLEKKIVTKSLDNFFGRKKEIVDEGNLSVRLNDIFTFSFSFLQLLISIIPETLFFIVSSIILLYLSKLIGVINLISVLALLILYYIASIKINADEIDIIRGQKKYFDRIIEIIDSKHFYENKQTRDYLNNNTQRIFKSYYFLQNQKQLDLAKVDSVEKWFSAITDVIMIITSFYIFSVRHKAGSIITIFSIFQFTQDAFKNQFSSLGNVITIFNSYNRILQIFDSKLTAKSHGNNKYNVRNIDICNASAKAIENCNANLIGKVIVLQGKSGSGKTTLMKMIVGSIPYYGTINFFDINSNIVDPKIIYVDNTGFVFDGTLRENLVGFTRVTDQTLKKLCQSFYLFKNNANIDFDMHLNRLHLSSGEKCKINIIRSILLSPDILILDETLSHIDDKTRKCIIEELKKYSFLLIIITHDKLPISFGNYYEVSKGQIRGITYGV